MERILRLELTDKVGTNGLVLIDCSNEYEEPSYHSLYGACDDLYPSADSSYRGRYIFIRSLNEKGIDRASFGFRDTNNRVCNASTLVLNYSFEQLKAILPVLDNAWSEFTEDRVVLKSNKFTITYDRDKRAFYDEYHNMVACTLN